MAVRWLPRARNNLQAIRAYIARDNPQAARAVARRIRDAADQLAGFPELGREGRVPGTRELIVPRAPYLIAYRVTPDGVPEIIAVLHGMQAWPEQL